MLSRHAFETLLSVLAGNRDAAGERYEQIRLRLLKYFEWRQCPIPEELADETLDRVARRLAEGERIRAGEQMVYVYGVARNVLLEYWKTTQRERAVAALPPPPADVLVEERRLAELRAECLQRCLRRQDGAARDLLLSYYRAEGAAKSERRQRIADALGVPINALRIRIHRLKVDLSRCVERCCRERAATSTPGSPHSREDA